MTAFWKISSFISFTFYHRLMVVVSISLRSSLITSNTSLDDLNDDKMQRFAKGINNISH